MKIYFMRHGETDWNKERRLQGQTDIPLNEYGIYLAKITASALKDFSFDRIYSSPLQRAYDTATLLSEGRNLTIITDDRLKELSFGEGEGISLTYLNTHPESPLYNFIHNPGSYLPPKDGETIESLYERCGSFLQQVIFPLESVCEQILVVCHGAVIRGMIYHMNQRDASHSWDVTHKNCSITIAEYKRGKFTLLEEAKIYYTQDQETTW